jgi:hypothetical protein
VSAQIFLCFSATIQLDVDTLGIELNPGDLNDTPGLNGRPIFLDFLAELFIIDHAGSREFHSLSAKGHVDAS